MRDPHEGTVKRAVDTVPFHLDHDSSFICIIHVNIFYVFTFCFSFLILKVFSFFPLSRSFIKMVNQDVVVVVNRFLDRM